MTVLVDSSVWIDYFRGGENDAPLDFLIDENLVVINDLILTELIPFLKLRNQRKLTSLLNAIHRLEINIDWRQLIHWQYQCLRKGINGIGIPDLIIAQNAIQHHCKLYSLDHHFGLLEDIAGLALFS